MPRGFHDSQHYLGRHRPARLKIVRCNSAIVALLTIVSTALTAYILTVIVSYPLWKSSGTNLFHTNQSRPSPVAAGKQEDHWPKRATVAKRHLNLGDDQLPKMQNRLDLGRNLVLQPPDSSSTNRSLSLGWTPIIAASEPVAVAVKRSRRELGPRVDTGERLRLFKRKIATLSREQLIKLLDIVRRSVEKRPTTSPPSNPRKLAETQNVATHSAPSRPESRSDNEIVQRSPKMSQLINYLERIESSSPKINMSKLEQLTALDNERSLVRIVKPEVMSSVFLETETANHNEHLVHVEEPRRSWDDADQIKSVAPSESGWPEQHEQEEVEDWPSATTAKPTKQRKKKKRKRVSTSTTSTTTTTTTSTTSTTAAPDLETTTFYPPSSPAPPNAFEEVWIEEEEDIVRPPRRKLKKYKKKTSPSPTTTSTTSTTSTTTTTTTTTPAPTTTTSTTSTTTSTTTEAPAIEEWPEEEEAWPEEPAGSTKAPKLWPGHKEDEKWPEDDWLSALREDLQNRLHIIYV